jgi:hypothetical protein
MLIFVLQDPLKKLIIEPDPRQMRKLESATVGNEHLVSVFALSLLHSFLKGGKVDIKDSEQLEMLDPFVVLFFKCMGSRFDRVLVGGLKVRVFVACVCLPHEKESCSHPTYLLLVRLPNPTNAVAQHPKQGRCSL